MSGLSAIFARLPIVQEQAAEVERYRHAFETTRDDRDRLAAELSRARDDRDRLAAELARVRGDLAQRELDLKSVRASADAATADRMSMAASLARAEQQAEATTAEKDRLAAELETYRHAYVTTASDRDRIVAQGGNRDRSAASNAVLPYSIVLSQPRSASLFVQRQIEVSNVVGSTDHIHALSPVNTADFWLRHPWAKRQHLGLDALAAVSQKRAFHKLGVAVGTGYLICSVRDPVERACSDYFFFRYHLEGEQDEKSMERVLAITPADVEAYLNGYPWGRDSDWFFEEFENHLGFDLAAFDRERGYSIVDNPPFRFLVIRSNRMAALQSALSELYRVDIRFIDAALPNDAAQIGYGQHYKSVMSKVRRNAEVTQAAAATRLARWLRGDGG